MLQQLRIQNYVLIDDLEVNLSNGLTIITGETGAGKTILLGALSLILGQRADSTVLRDKNKKCIIEGLVFIKPYKLQGFFQRHELDYEDITSLRREISAEGKSRAFINDTPVNLQQLKELGAGLVDIHSQHETLNLQDSDFQLSVTDASAKHEQLLNQYKTGFKSWQQNIRQLNELHERDHKAKVDQDYFQFQFNELETAALREGEQEALEQELETLTHAEEIKTRLNQAASLLKEGDFTVLGRMEEVLNLLRGISRYNHTLGVQTERMKSVMIETKDLAAELESLEQQISHDANRIRVLQDRLDMILGLQQKHRVHTIHELLDFQQQLADKLFNIQSLESELSALQCKIQEQETELRRHAGILSANRKAAAVTIEREVTNMLVEIGLPNAVLKIEQQETAQLNENGSSKIRFLFSANQGVALQELSKVASGGEMSRLMLCIKALMARQVTLPTIIFDEIDTGISGEIAFKVGAIIEKMSRKHQVIAITHLPQMASRGDAHLLVYKKVIKGVTHTGIRSLNQEERISEIAKMLSGDQLTDAALENARELLQK